MTFTALDTEQSSPSPPDDAMAPPGSDAATEPAESEAHEAVASSPDAHHGKAPAASLISIAIKHKPTGPTKAGDLTRFFELAHRQPPPPAPSAAPVAETPPAAFVEAESAPEVEPEAPLSIELPAAPSEPEPTSLETTPEPPPAEPAAFTEPAALPEVTIEPSFPLMLAPPAAAVEDVAVPAAAQPEPAPIEDYADVVDEPTWSEAATVDAPLLSAEAIEPLKVSLVPMEETPAAEVLEPTREDPEPVPEAAVTIPEPAAASTDPAAVPEIAPAAVVVAPDPPPAVEPLPVAIPVAPPPPVFKDLADYWRSLRNGADHPTAELVDRDLVTQRWPGTLLITYTPASHDPRGELRPGRVTRLGAACAETQNVVDAGSHSTEWMLEVAHTALVNDEPLEEQQRLSTLTGAGGFRMVALPLGSPKGLPTAVLCTLLPCPGAPRFGKRRIWL